MMSFMRTTIRVDDDVLERLRAEARRENISLTRLVNRTLKAGLEARRAPQAKRSPYREHPASLGQPQQPLEKARALADALEDEEIARKLAQRK